MLHTLDMVRMNIRNRDGKRVFYLAKGDTLTPGARDWLTRERVRILDPKEVPLGEYRMENGAVLRQKPEQMTHLNGDILVYKTHPRIAFRGRVDTLEAELLMAQVKCPGFREELGEILGLARMLIRCEVMGEPVPEGKLWGLSQEELRKRSHFPQKYYGQGHFMPEWTDGEQVLVLNRCRCTAREAELAAARAFTTEDGTCGREDILKAMNRMSSMLYILMIRAKAGC